MSELGTQYFLGNTEIINSFVGDVPVLINPFQIQATMSLDYLVVAGGGASGGGGGAGGGGAGGYLSGTSTIYSNSTASIYVGKGGLFSQTSPSNGENSYIIISNTNTTATGGGYGADGGNGANTGGSGGGGSWFFAPAAGTTGQGNAGGNFGGTNANRAGGGGGGANAVGSDGSVPFERGGPGGAGKEWLNGNYYAGGGGGATSTVISYRAPGGIGGGGTGCGNGVSFGDAGSANTGGGAGGGAGAISGNSGGSGIVIVRYLDGIVPSGSITGGDNVFVSASYVYHEFLQTGSAILTFN